MRTDPISDNLWTQLALHLPAHPPRLEGGRPAVSDRAILNGILVILLERRSWTALDPEWGYGSGKTCQRRLREWQQDGNWERMLSLLQAAFPRLTARDWARLDPK